MNFNGPFAVCKHPLLVGNGLDTQTIRGYRSKYENHIKPLIGSRPASGPFLKFGDGLLS